MASPVTAAVAAAPVADIGRFRLRAVVVRVIDGDTLDVRLATGRRDRIRLLGIDTPELRPSECYGPQARTRARMLAQGKRVLLVGDGSQATRDRFGRRLAYVALPNGRDLGRQIDPGLMAQPRWLELTRNAAVAGPAHPRARRSRTGPSNPASAGDAASRTAGAVGASGKPTR